MLPYLMPVIGSEPVGVDLAHVVLRGRSKSEEVSKKVANDVAKDVGKGKVLVIVITLISFNNKCGW